MNTDVKRIVKSKERERRRLAALPFAEKLILMEQLRDREADIIAHRHSPPDQLLSERVMLLMEQRAAYGSAETREERHAG